MADNAIDVALLEQLEVQFSNAALSLQKLRDDVSTMKTRTTGLEAAYGIAPPPPCAASPAHGSSASAAAATLGGKLAIGKGDIVLTALQGYLGANASPGPKSIYSDGAQTLEGALPILMAYFPGLVGSTPVERAQVDDWCKWSMEPAIEEAPMKPTGVQIEVLQRLNAQLVSSVYVACAYRLTLADLICWAMVAPIIRPLLGGDREMIPNVVRWFNLVQSTPGLTASKVMCCTEMVNPTHEH